MVDTCRFFEHNNIANFFRLDHFTIVLFFYQTETIFFSQKRLHTSRREKLQLVKEKMKQSFFCERIAYCFAQWHIAQYDG